MDIRGDNLEHFQKHWGRGQPVIVRNVLQSTSDVCWDPMVMFCNYLKNNAARSQNGQATDCLDWFEVGVFSQPCAVSICSLIVQVPIMFPS
jgi:lysine-specific demethylase 3